MKNIKRKPDYINIKHKVDSCKTLKQLQSYNEIVNRFYYANKTGQDEKELLVYYVMKLDEFKPDDMEAIPSKNLRYASGRTL